MGLLFEGKYCSFECNFSPSRVEPIEKGGKSEN